MKSLLHQVNVLFYQSKTGCHWILWFWNSLNPLFCLLCDRPEQYLPDSAQSWAAYQPLQAIPCIQLRLPDISFINKPVRTKAVSRWQSCRICCSQVVFYYRHRDRLSRSVWFGRRRLAKRRGTIAWCFVLAGVFGVHLDDQGSPFLLVLERHQPGALAPLPFRVELEIPWS